MGGHCKNWSIARAAGEAIMRLVGEGVVKSCWRCSCESVHIYIYIYIYI